LLFVDDLSRLLLAARDGDRDALERFVRQTQHDVWALCRSLGDVDTAEDLVQDSYARALGSIDRYRGEGPARNWLLSITRRTCIDTTRRRIRRRRWDAGNQVDDQPQLDPDVTVVEELLDVLDQERREAFALTQLAGCSYREAADILGCPIGTVRSRVARARETLLAAVEQTSTQPTEPDAGTGTGTDRG
jgi:RNA polymerase sigma-70 factor (ECF subfamily)